MECVIEGCDERITRNGPVFTRCGQCGTEVYVKADGTQMIPLDQNGLILDDDTVRRSEQHR